MTLAEIRSRKKITQQQLAEITGLSQVAISRIQRGIARPRLQTRKLLEFALGTQVDWQQTKQLGNIPSEIFIHQILNDQ